MVLDYLNSLRNYCIHYLLTFFYLLAHFVYFISLFIISNQFILINNLYSHFSVLSDPTHTHRRYHSDYSSSSESPSMTSSDPDYRRGSSANNLIHLWHVFYMLLIVHYFSFVLSQTAKKPEDLRRYSSQVGLSEHDSVSLGGAQRHRYSLLLWSIMHVGFFQEPTHSETLLWLRTLALVNDNPNLIPTCSSLVLIV